MDCDDVNSVPMSFPPSRVALDVWSAINMESNNLNTTPSFVFRITVLIRELLF